MAKQKYRLQYEVGGRSMHEYIEASSMVAAIKKSDNLDFAIVSVSLAKKSIAREVKQERRTDGGGYTVFLPEGVWLVATTLIQLNNALERLGYKPVRATKNLLGDGKRFFIDLDTPSYLDPGSEAYHSS